MGEKILAMIISALVKHLPEYLSAIAAWVNRAFKKITRAKKVEEAEKQFDAVVDDKTKTPEDRAKAYEDFINS